MKTQSKASVGLVLAAILVLAGFRSEGAGSNGLELKQLVEQCLPGARLVPEAPARPRTLLAKSGDPLDLMKALLEDEKPRKGAGYWTTPTMRYLGRQRPMASTPDEAAAVIRLLQALTGGPKAVKHNNYVASPVAGGWVVQVADGSANHPGKAALTPPYELLVDSGGHVTQVRERCYDYLGSPAVYDHTVRTVYAREMMLNGAINYQPMLEKELAQEWEKEKAGQKNAGH